MLSPDLFLDVDGLHDVGHGHPVEGDPEGLLLAVGDAGQEGDGHRRSLDVLRRHLSCSTFKLMLDKISNFREEVKK